PEASLESYGRALAIARKLGPSRTTLELLVRNYSKISNVYMWAMGRSSEARENLRLAVQVADSIPAKTGEPAYQVRAEVYGLLGDIDRRLHPDRANDPHRRPLKIARDRVSARPTSKRRQFL